MISIYAYIWNEGFSTSATINGSVAGQEFLLQCSFQISLSKVKWNKARGVEHIGGVFHYQEDKMKVQGAGASFDQRLASDGGNMTNVVLRQSFCSHWHTGFFS